MDRASLEHAVAKLALGLLMAALALSALACGEDDAGPQKEPFRFEAATTAKKKGDRKGKRGKGMDPSEYVAKEEWGRLQPHFLNFSKLIEEDIGNRSVAWKYKDAFATRVDKFYPPEEESAGSALDLKKVGKSETATAKKEPDRTIASILEGIIQPDGGKDLTVDEIDPRDLAAAAGPLTRAPLSRYSFSIIMTGVASPEALVVAPDGLTHVVRLNDKIGNEGGYVSDIFKHKVLVRLPEKEEPLEISLAPQMLPSSFQVY